MLPEQRRRWWARACNGRPVGARRFSPQRSLVSGDHFSPDSLRALRSIWPLDLVSSSKEIIAPTIWHSRDGLSPPSSVSKHRCTRSDPLRRAEQNTHGGEERSLRGNNLFQSTALRTPPVCCRCLTVACVMRSSNAGNRLGNV